MKNKAAKSPPPRKEPPPRALTLDVLPVTWWVATGAQTVGLCVDEHVWTGNVLGEVLCLDRATGTSVREMKVPAECVAVSSDERWKYAGCADGNVYDLTGDVPRAVYRLEGERVDWLEVFQGTLCVSDHAGTVTVIDVDGNVRWQHRDPEAREAWVLRADEDGLYHGSYVGLRKYDWSGERLWHKNVGDVRYGCIEGDTIAVTSGFYTRSSQTELLLIDRETGKTRWKKSPSMDVRSGFQSNGGEAVGVGRNAAGELRYYVSVGAWVFCYDGDGLLRWQAPTRCQSLCNLQVDGELLYFASNNGTIGCADVSERGLQLVQSGADVLPKARRQARVKDRDAQVERVRSNPHGGVVVECVRQGDALRMRVASKGYNREWFCQFPHDLREEGARYVVDEVREAKQGGFYRVLGTIRRLVTDGNER